MLWLSMVDKYTKQQFKFCVCYLPPSNSTRQINTEQFLNTLMGYIYEFQENSTVTIFGDFNIRVGDEEDFIAGVDNLPNREIVDYTKSQFCSTFIDFLIRTYVCILNGRGSKNNTFTSVSSKVHAVVDFVPF